MKAAAFALCEDDRRFRQATSNKHAMVVEEGGRWYQVRSDPEDSAHLRCSGCAEWRVWRLICRHTMAVAKRDGRLGEHVNWVRIVKAQTDAPPPRDAGADCSQQKQLAVVSADKLAKNDSYTIINV